MDPITYVREIPSCIAGLCLFAFIFSAAGFAILAYVGEHFRKNH